MVIAYLPGGAPSSGDAVVKRYMPSWSTVPDALRWFISSVKTTVARSGGLPPLTVIVPLTGDSPCEQPIHRITPNDSPVDVAKDRVKSRGINGIVRQVQRIVRATAQDSRRDDHPSD